MPTPTWAKKLVGLIKKAVTSTDPARLRNDFSEVISTAVEKKVLDAASAAQLRRWLVMIEPWVTSSHADPQAAHRVWAELYAEGREWAPTELLTAILGKFPDVPVGGAEWDPFILGCREPELVDVLAKRRLIRQDDMRRLSATRTEDFYFSAGLDVALQRSWLTDPWPIWEFAAGNRPRPSGLHSREEVLIGCYVMRPGADADRRLAALLGSDSQDRPKLLRLLLQRGSDAIRFCRYLASEKSNLTGTTCAQDGVLEDWVGVCETEVERGGTSTRSTASAVLAEIRLTKLLGDTTGTGTGVLPDTTTARRASERQALRALREGDAGSGAGQAVLVLTADEVHQVVQDYLRALPVGSGDSTLPPERSLRRERYLGVRQATSSIATALEEQLDGSALRDVIEASLFNCGVRALEVVGATVPFNGTFHECDEPGLFADDPVIVSSPGRGIGEGNDRIVIVKARVRLAPLTADLEPEGGS